MGEQTTCDKTRLYQGDEGIGMICGHCDNFLDYQADEGWSVFWCMCHG